MKKSTLISIFSVFLLVYPSNLFIDYNEIYRIARIHNSDKDSKEYAEDILKWSAKYNVDSILIAHIGYMESGLQSWVKSSCGARGPYQITRCYDNLLFVVNDGYVGRYIKQDKIPKSDWNKYYYNVNYSTEMCCIIISSLLKKYNGNMNLVILDYWCGPSSFEFYYYRTHLIEFYKTSYYRIVMGIYKI